MFWASSTHTTMWYFPNSCAAFRNARPAVTLSSPASAYGQSERPTATLRQLPVQFPPRSRRSSSTLVTDVPEAIFRRRSLSVLAASTKASMTSMGDSRELGSMATATQGASGGRMAPPPPPCTLPSGPTSRRPGALEHHRATAYPPIMETAGCLAKDIEFRISPPEERFAADFGTICLVQPGLQR